MGVGFASLTHAGEALVDDGQEHAHAHEHHREDEQREHERAQERRRCAQLVRVELHQHHLEQHLRGVQQRGTRRQFPDEQQVEQRQEGQKNDCEHRHERQQILGSVLKGLNEEHQPMVEPTQTNELERGEETGERQEINEDVAHIHHELQIDERVTIGLGELITDVIQFSTAPYVNAQTGPRTNDDSDVDVRPELTEVLTLQSDQRLCLDEHHVDDEHQIQNARHQLHQRVEH